MDASSITGNRCHVQGYASLMKFIRAGNLKKAKEPQHHHKDNLVDKAVKSEISWLEFQRDLNAMKKDEDRIMKKIRLLILSGGGASGITKAMEENNLCAENEKGKQTDRELRENRVLADLREFVSSRRVVNVDETPIGSNLKGKVVPLKRQFGGKHELKRSKQQSGGGASGITKAMEENNLCAENEKGKQTDRELRENRVLADLRKLISSRRVVNVDETPSGSNLKGEVVPLKRQFGGKHELKRSKRQLAAIMEEEKHLVKKLTFENEYTIAKLRSKLGIIFGNDVHDSSVTQEKNAVIQTDDKLEENDKILKPATIRTEIDVDMSVNGSTPSQSNLEGKKNLPKSKSTLKCKKCGRFKRNKRKKDGRFTRKKSRKS